MPYFRGMRIEEMLDQIDAQEWDSEACAIWEQQVATPSVVKLMWFTAVVREYTEVVRQRGDWKPYQFLNNVIRLSDRNRKARQQTGHDFTRLTIWIQKSQANRVRNKSLRTQAQREALCLYHDRHP